MQIKYKQIGKVCKKHNKYATKYAKKYVTEYVKYATISSDHWIRCAESVNKEICKVCCICKIKCKYYAK